MAPGSPYQDLCDLEGKKIATFTAVSITLVWGMYAKEMCGLDLKAGGGDYELVVTDIQNLGDLVARGDADACLCLPDFALPQLVARHRHAAVRGQVRRAAVGGELRQQPRGPHAPADQRLRGP